MKLLKYFQSIIKKLPEKEQANSPKIILNYSLMNKLIINMQCISTRESAANEVTAKFKAVPSNEDKEGEISSPLLHGTMTVVVNVLGLEEAPFIVDDVYPIEFVSLEGE